MTTGSDAEWVVANQNYLTAGLALLGCRLAGEATAAADRQLAAARKAMPGPPALESVAAALELSDFERDTLLLCAGVELDSAIARACATANGDPARSYATFSLALAVLPAGHWSACTPAAALRRWRMVEVVHPEVPVTSPLRVDERILHALTGVAYLDARLESVAEPVTAATALPPSLQAAADRLAGEWAAGRRCGLHGRTRHDLRAVVAAASVVLGLDPVCLRAGDLPGPPSERDLLARLCDRETVLSGRSWAIEVDDRLPDAARVAVDFAARMHAPVAVTARVRAGGSGDGLTELEVAPAQTREQRDLWVRALGPARTAVLGSWVDRVAGQFDLGLADIEAAARGSHADSSRAGPELWDACRRHSRPAMADLAQRIEPTAGWDDLVLPGPQRRSLQEIAVHVRHRLTVMDDWGFAERSARGLGVAALFSGPSGTGKTLAAEVLAADLRLDLYRVDLSQVVSKYIGETEKNLRQIFDAAEAGGAVLLFDEADALFGKRSEVKDSHDRYANIEVSYLLQRMETYRGLAVLTTNLRTAMDSAFLRRLRFIVTFPFPDVAGRADIWRRAFPARTPTDGLDPGKLARLTVAGGTIRNIALAAAFLAAAAGEPVRMTHLLAAARSEYTKLERPLTDAEVAGWTS